jgi:hypothetical protein
MHALNFPYCTDLSHMDLGLLHVVQDCNLRVKINSAPGSAHHTDDRTLVLLLLLLLLSPSVVT